MVTHHVPVLVWSDRERFYSAAAVGFAGDDRVGHGETPERAVHALEQALSRQSEQNAWMPAPDFLDAELLPIRVDVRPQLEAGLRTYPGAERIPLRVPVLRGERAHGGRCAALPLLGLEFDYHDSSELKELVGDAVRMELHGSSPEELIRRMEPRELELWHVSYVERNQRPRRAIEDAAPELRAIAVPLRELRPGRGERAWEREEAVDRLAARLAVPRGSVLLVGESGVGKTTILLDAVRKLRTMQRDVPDDDGQERVDARQGFWVTSGHRVIAGMKFLGQWEQRLEAALDQLARARGVLCAERLIGLVNAGDRDPAASVAAFLLPGLRRGELRMVAEATPAELDVCRRRLPALLDVFSVLEVEPLDHGKTRSVLTRLCEARSKAQPELPFATEVPATVQRLFSRFEPYSRSPGAAVEFTSELFDKARRERAARVEDARVLAAFTKRTGLPELLLRDDLPLEFESVVSALRSGVVGQDRACEALADVVTRLKAGLHNPGRPLGVYLFAGPTGVGKTELARTLARWLFGQREENAAASSAEQRGDRLVVLDMSEYSAPGSGDRLLQDHRGEPSALVAALREQPFSVVLFDEIEKASPDVYDVLLTLLDEGRLTDSFGRLTTFQSAVVILTSNLGSDRRDGIGFGGDAADGAHAAAVARYFRPEFFNRLDGVLEFDSLDAVSLRAIAHREIEKLEVRAGLARRRVRLQPSAALVEHLLRIGSDRRYGARPLLRAIEQTLVAPVARFLVEQPSVSGVTLRVDWTGSAVNVDVVRST